jgi:hypothetical protein
LESKKERTISRKERTMLKRTPAWRKMLLAKPRIVAIGIALVAALSTAVFTGGTAYASGTNCATGTNGLSKVCIYIDGSSNVVAAAVGSVSVTSSKGIGEYAEDGSWVYWDGHVQVVNPKGDTLCNSNTIVLYAGAGTSCESPDQGATYTGSYCTIFWVYRGGDYSVYGNVCRTVS